jgi:HAD superfamily hydrolase (TIGR01662 family)
MRQQVVLGAAKAVLLDFDGPVCSVFSHYPASVVADELRSDLADRGIDVTGGVAGISDPLAVLRWTWNNQPQVIKEVEAVLVAAERHAVRSARSTPNAHLAIKAAQQSGRPVAIVSNNSKAAINDYLHQHGIASNVAAIAARPFGNPEVMKPNPALVLDALHSIGVHPESCVFVGDATTDIEAGRAAGVRVVGYAKTPRHVAALAAAGPDMLIESMRELVDAMRAETLE